MDVLITGFEPFADSTVNPSERLARRLVRRPPSGMRVRSRILPVVGGHAQERLLDAMQRVRPDAVICLGESRRSTAITVERVALNLRDYAIADNAGARVRDEAVVEGAPAAYFSTLPVRRMVDASVAAGVPAALSLSAGAFLCNEIMFTLLHAVHARPTLIPAGFVHVPQLPEQATARRDQASMSLDTAERGLHAGLTALRRLGPGRAPRHRRRSV